LDSALQNSASGESLGAYMSFVEIWWKELQDPELATAYITVLLGKLIFTELKVMQQGLNEGHAVGDFKLEALNVLVEYADEQLIANNVTLQEVIDHFRFGLHRFDPSYPLLNREKEPLKRKNSGTERKMEKQVEMEQLEVMFFTNLFTTKTG
jgi:hypothetical protein